MEDFWKVLIVNLRTTTISFAIYKTIVRESEEKKLMKEINHLEDKAQKCPSQDIMDNLEIAKEKMEQIPKYKLDGIITRARAKWHEEGEKSTAYFLSLEKRAFSDKLIVSLKGTSGELITSKDRIVDVLVNHYTDMFKRRSDNQLSEHNMNNRYLIH